MIMTDEEKALCSAIIREGVAKSTQFEAMFERGTRGLMVFMATMDALRVKYPAIFGNVDRASAMLMLAHWVAAGQPDSPATVPELLLKKFGPDAFHKIEGEYADGASN